MKLTKKNVVITILSILSLILIYFIPNFIGMKELNIQLFHYVYFYLIICIGIFILKKCHLFSPLVLFAIFFSKSIGLCPLFYHLSNGKYHPNQYSIILISFILFLCGYGLISIIDLKKICKLNNLKNNKKTSKSSNINNKKKSTITYDTNIAKLFCYIIIIISLIADVIYLIKNSSILFNGSYNDARIEALSGNGMIIEMMGLGTIGLCLLFEMVLEKKYSLKKFILISLIILPASLIKGFRSALIVPILIMCLMYSKKKKISNKKIIFIGLSSILAIALLGVGRQLLSDSQSNDFMTSLYSMFRNGSINLNAILETFPKKVPFQKGHSYLINLIMLRPGPDLDFTLWLKETVGHTFSGGGMVPTIIGEFYLNFNFIGLYIGMIVLGMVFKIVEKYYVNSNHTYYSAFILYTFIAILGGGIANSEISLLITSLVYVSFIVFNYFLRYFSGKKRCVSNE